MLSTDDAARRVPFIWLGPEDFEAPFEARGQAWMAALVAVPLCWVLAWLMTPMFLVNSVVPGGFLAVVVHVLFAVIVGTVTAILLVRAVGRHVTATRPIRHHLAQLQNELDAPRPERPRVYARSVPHDLFIDRRLQHRRDHVTTVDSAIAQWEA